MGPRISEAVGPQCPCVFYTTCLDPELFLPLSAISCSATPSSTPTLSAWASEWILPPVIPPLSLFFFFFFFLAVLHGLWDLSFLQGLHPGSWQCQHGVLTTTLPGNSPPLSLELVSQFALNPCCTQCTDPRAGTQKRTQQVHT